jgi:hypothetical protein
MKQKDIILLIVSVFFSILVSVIAAKFIFSAPTNLNQQVDVIPVISSDFPATNPVYFNAQALDPTQLINIGPSNNTQPFNGTSN